MPKIVLDKLDIEEIAYKWAEENLTIEEGKRIEVETNILNQVEINILHTKKSKDVVKAVS